ncbi:hypothetical protein [Burkholderia gladioli]|uniref:hypothetical protein n=1 Tax=Burkholderia gladioli TaxID=28095 RepID=UPI0016405066|nr:hypothetical protein [Burkholderia gladioli]
MADIALFQDDAFSLSSLTAAINDQPAVPGRVDAMRNRATGAVWVLGIGLGAVQAFVVGSIVWVFTHVNEADVLNRLQQQRIETLELAIGRGGKP